jgi:alkaline phosphatase D
MSDRSVPISAAPVSRRSVLHAAAGLLATAGAALPQALAAAGSSPFTLGVASGDPLPESVILWTRLAPDPFEPDGGMPSKAVPVQWEVATDERMRRVVRQGASPALPELGHSVHVDARGLEPGRWYWYRFRSGPHESSIGRTRTAPAAGAVVTGLRFAFASCQNWPNGYFSALGRLAEEDLELVFHLGDYIYEAPIAAKTNRAETPPEAARAEPATLATYRYRHALYRMDPDLQAAHRAFPWVVAWDDHEVADNWAGDLDKNASPVEAFRRRRAAAFQAYYEHMPLRLPPPAGPDYPIYRRFTWGRLAEFNVLDTRQYRTDQPCGDGRKPRCPETLSPRATMLGKTQEGWLCDGLDRSQARWNVLAQQIFMSQFDAVPGPDATYAMDKWDGYLAARQRLFHFLAARRPANPIAIAGDAHLSLVSDLKLDFENPRSPIVAAEFSGTAISSGGVTPAAAVRIQEAVKEQPHIRYYEGLKRGYVSCLVEPGTWRTDLRAVQTITRRDSPVETDASFVVEAGRPGIQRG